MAKVGAIGLENPQILRPVIERVAVQVMNDFRAKEKAAQLFFHHQPMLGNVALFGRVRMSGLP